MSVPQPLVVATDWGAAAALPLGTVFAAIAVAAIGYRYALRRARPFPLHVVLALSAAGLALAWSAPVLFSSDVYAYAAYGEMARIGLNPYAHPPIGLANPVVLAAQAQWVTAFPICVYGPAFVAFSRLVMTALAPFGFLVQLNAFRVGASAALLLCSALAYAAYRGDKAVRLRAAAAIGLNPVAIWCAAEGHNDAIAFAVVLAGFALARRHSPGLGAAVAGLSALVKPPGVAAAAALGIVDRRARIGAAAGIAIAAALSTPLIIAVTRDLAPHGHYAPAASLQAIFAPLGPAPAVAATVAVAAALVAQGVSAIRRSADQGWIWLGLAAWTLIPNPYPWYALWLLGVAALAPQTPVARVAFALSLTAMLRYVPDAVGTPSAGLSVALAVGAVLPLAALIPRRSATGYNERPA